MYNDNRSFDLELLYGLTDEMAILGIGPYPCPYRV